VQRILAATLYVSVRDSHPHLSLAGTLGPAWIPLGGNGATPLTIFAEVDSTESSPVVKPARGPDNCEPAAYITGL
jgi:hypothetical protein